VHLQIMELRHLRYFLAVAEELNFSRAAEKLHIAQPPLSQQIRDLETELGVQLFLRNKRSVELTEAGVVFFKEVPNIFTKINNAIKSAQRASRGEIGTLAIGFNSSAAHSVLPNLLHQFREYFPDVELILHELTTTQQLEKLEYNQIDLGLLYLPIDTTNLQVMNIWQEGLLVALPETHALVDRLEVSLQELINEYFILPHPQLGAALYAQIMGFLAQFNFYPKVIQSTTLLQTAVSLVAGGVGVALVPDSLQNCQRIGVVYKKLAEPTPEVKTAIVWRQQDSSRVLQRFLEFMQKATLI
jgi:DNA-binding transcriptional LysR family regulator